MAWLPRVLWTVPCVALVGLALAVYLRGQASDQALQEAFARRGKVAVAGTLATEWPELGTAAEGTTLVPVAELPELEQALRAPVAGQYMPQLLRELALQGLAVPPVPPLEDAPATVLGTLARYQTVQGLAGLHLSRSVALYGLKEDSRIPAPYRDALAQVARRSLAGEPLPRFSSFPDLLRQVRHVEVMVMLRSGSRPRLWRSARGSSIARAFLTAVRVAGQRWREREQAMGGALRSALPSLTVDVMLLHQDGVLGSRNDEFLRAAVSRSHGIAYERKGAWRYMLPQLVHVRGREPADAFAELCRDNGLAEDAFRAADLRILRILPELVASSPATAP